MSGESSVMETLTEQDKGIAGDEGDVGERVIFHRGGQEGFFERILQKIIESVDPGRLGGSVS